MTHKTKKILLAAILACSSGITSFIEASCNTSCCNETTDCCSGCTQSQNLWQPHAFSVSMSREILLEKPAWTNMDDVEGWHGTFGVGFEYMKSLNNSCGCEPILCCKTLGSMPFWAPNKSNQMTVGNNSGDFDLDAYQMGLGPVTTNGAIQLNTSVFQTGGDIFLYTGAHRSERGFFFKLHGPVGVINVNTKLKDSGDLEAVEYPVGSLTKTTETEAPYETMAEAFAGGQSAGDLRTLKFGLINCNCSSAVKFGDLAVSVGYNFYATESAHLGAAIRFTAPTGNKATAIKMLEPIFGRNGHWAVGGELIGHWRCWEADEDDKFMDVWFDGTIEHLFNSQHMRSFDLKGNGAGSKYLLLANYATNTYQNEITNAINITTLPVQSVFSAEGNFALMFDFHWCNWSIGFGYEGWGRTCEQLCLDCSCPGVINYNNYAVIGRQTAWATDGSTQLDLCQPSATIGKSEDHRNTAGENAALGILDATVATNRLSADNAIDIASQRAHAAYTSKPFAQIAYTCKDSDYTPYLAISGGAEISNRDNSAVSYWTIGLQGGLVF